MSLRFEADWRFSPARSREIVKALVEAGREVSYALIDSQLGHDDFLMALPEYHRQLRAWLGRVAEAMQT